MPLKQNSLDCQDPKEEDSRDHGEYDLGRNNCCTRAQIILRLPLDWHECAKPEITKTAGFRNEFR